MSYDLPSGVSDDNTIASPDVGESQKGQPKVNQIAKAANKPPKQPKRELSLES